MRVRAIIEIKDDAFGYARGVLLMLFAYHLVTLSCAAMNYPTYDKELVASCQKMKRCRAYILILAKETCIHTNHKPLQFL